MKFLKENGFKKSIDWTLKLMYKEEKEI